MKSSPEADAKAHPEVHQAAQPAPIARTTPTTCMAPTAPGRADWLDALRGAAIVWMVVYHFCFDLNLYGLLEPRQRFSHDPFWTLQRTAIVSLFLLCAGMGQALAEAAQQPWPRFWRRWAQVAGCALLVSVGSWWMFPRTWISFGVLHGLAVMLLLTRWLARRSGNTALLVLAALALALPWWVQHPVFDSRWLNGVGLVTHKPRTEDFVPLLPWWGVMLAGFVAGRWWVMRRGGAGAPPVTPAKRVVSGPMDAADLSGAAAGAPALRQVRRVLVWLGRRPLTIYMAHQPILLGLVWLATRL